MLKLFKAHTGLIALGLAILACNTPQSPVTPSVPPAAIIATSTAEPATAAPTLIPTRAIPPDWVEASNDGVGVSLFLPPGWELTQRDGSTLDIRQAGADGWMEISRLDETTAASLGITYSTGETAEALIADLVQAAREDGSFGDPQPLDARNDVIARFAEGSFAEQGESIVMAVVAGADHGYVIIGHQGEVEDWKNLKLLYLEMIQTVLMK